MKMYQISEEDKLKRISIFNQKIKLNREDLKDKKVELFKVEEELNSKLDVKKSIFSFSKFNFNVENLENQISIFSNEIENLEHNFETFENFFEKKIIKDSNLGLKPSVLEDFFHKDITFIL